MVATDDPSGHGATRKRFRRSRAAAGGAAGVGASRPPPAARA